MEDSVLNVNLYGNPTLHKCFKLKEITKSTEQSTYLDVNSFSASQEIPRIWWSL